MKLHSWGVNMGLNKALELLHSAGIDLSTQQRMALDRHLDLIRAWNRLVSVVSEGDLAFLEDRHLIDSISLVPVLLSFVPQGGLVLDIGPGAGFPAIPLAVILPEREFVLVERSDKKCGFLRKVQGALGLHNVTLVSGAFPRAAEGLRPAVITARAVETPVKVMEAMERFIEDGAVYVCQTGRAEGILGEKFHVEQWEDAWTALGLRRGTLELVTRAPRQAT
jgi:16S rRNA (guanine527-N7)-methyltransferase